jgi:gamma-glutamyl hercynylcysteine S-oxide synthase
MLAKKKAVEKQTVALADPLLERLAEARRQSDSLFGLVRDGSIYERPIPERHRIIFYVGHLEAFDWNLLKGVALEQNSAAPQAIHPKFDRLFAFGIDPVGGGLPTDVPSDWPELDAVREYVSNVRSAVDEILKVLSSNPNIAQQGIPSNAQRSEGYSLDTMLNVAIEHRLMHVETLAYMLHQLPFSSKVNGEERDSKSLHLVARPVIHQMVSVAAGETTLGLAHYAGEFSEKNQFGWDNEFDAHVVHVPAFAMDRYKVTNRQFLEFMAAGGYDTRKFWADDDWNWKSAQQISHPLFWKQDDKTKAWVYRTMFDDMALPLDWPVYVSQAEASAYARWAGRSLPTEAEWQRAAYGGDVEARAYPWGNEPPNSSRGNFNFYSWDPTPVNAFPKGQSAFGVHDMVGNGWEWMSTAFKPFPGFKPFPFYPGYSADFFDGKHYVMKGGSARTAACMLRPSFRNWFQAHYQNVYAGFRCVGH